MHAIIRNTKTIEKPEWSAEVKHLTERFCKCEYMHHLQKNNENKPIHQPGVGDECSMRAKYISTDLSEVK